MKEPERNYKDAYNYIMEQFRPKIKMVDEDTQIHEYNEDVKFDNKMIKKEDLVAPKEENRAYDLSNESNKGKTKQEPIETLDISDDETKNDVDLKNKINPNPMMMHFLCKI